MRTMMTAIAVMAVGTMSAQAQQGAVQRTAAPSEVARVAPPATPVTGGNMPVATVQGGDALASADPNDPTFAACLLRNRCQTGMTGGCGSAFSYGGSYPGGAGIPCDDGTNGGLTPGYAPGYAGGYIGGGGFSGGCSSGGFGGGYGCSSGGYGGGGQVLGLALGYAPLFFGNRGGGYNVNNSRVTNVNNTYNSTRTNIVTNTHTNNTNINNVVNKTFNGGGGHIKPPTPTAPCLNCAVPPPGPATFVGNLPSTGKNLPSVMPGNAVAHSGSLPGAKGNLPTPNVMPHGGNLGSAHVQNNIGHAFPGSAKLGNVGGSVPHAAMPGKVAPTPHLGSAATPHVQMPKAAPAPHMQMAHAAPAPRMSIPKAAPAPKMSMPKAAPKMSFGQTKGRH